jgi:hypothetical protein
MRWRGIGYHFSVVLAILLNDWCAVLDRATSSGFWNYPMRYLLAFVLFSWGTLLAAVPPLKQAHAHNDYEHTRPLLDALDQGFCSVEADIFLTSKGLMIGHTLLDLKSDRTLEKLYLKPLHDRAKANGGKVYRDGPPFYLLIDVKTDAKKTYPVLHELLEKYADLLTTTRDGKTETKAVTVIISGNCDRDAINKQEVRYAAIDGRPQDLEKKKTASRIPWVSADWGSQFKWKGVGPFPEEERKKLQSYVAKAHQQGRMVRFWGTPDQPALWQVQLDAGVDLINTDRLADLKAFLLKQAKK